MTTTIRLRPRPQAGPTLLAAALIVLLAGVATNSVDNETTGATTANTTSPAAIAPTSTERTRATRITIQVGDDTATAALADTPAARDFAAMLPVTILTRDLFGQAKADQLPRNLAAGDDGRASDYAVGDLGYWSPTGDLAIFYADDGQSLPSPGLVRLGTVDTGLTAIADAGNRSPMIIDLAD